MLRRPAPALARAVRLLLAGLLYGGGVWAARVNKHKPWLEPTYHGIVTENDNTVLLDPPHRPGQRLTAALCREF